jgi:hypothetical protein
VVTVANISATQDDMYRHGQVVWMGWAADAGHELND